MLFFPDQNPYFIYNSAFSSFLGGKGGYNPPNLVLTRDPGEGNSYPIKILVIGIPPGVTSVINELHGRKFAEVPDWTPGIKAQKPGEIMRMTTRYFLIN